MQHLIYEVSFLLFIYIEFLLNSAIPKQYLQYTLVGLFDAVIL